MARQTETATFGAGCFWGVEEGFSRVPGVVSTAVGYSGGWMEDPSYEDVCTGSTGHAEVVQVEYDPDQVSYAELLEVFWGIHDPTTPDRQGPDVGSQYRSVILFHNTSQEAEAKSSMARVEKSGRFRGAVVTELKPFERFYRAEEYHQRYFEKRGQGGCRA